MAPLLRVGCDGMGGDSMLLSGVTMPSSSTSCSTDSEVSHQEVYQRVRPQPG